MLRPLLLSLLCTFLPCPAQTAAATHERQIVAELERVRMHPREFLAWLQDQGGTFEGSLWRLPGRTPIRTEEGEAAVQELIAFLEHTPPTGPLHWSEGLSRAARELVQSQGPTGGTGHVGPDGSTLQGRTLHHGLFLARLGEIIDYGSSEPRWIVLDLLIDDGQPGRPHRKAIFEPSFHVAGAAIGPHASYGVMVVVDLADGFTDNP